MAVNCRIGALIFGLVLSLSLAATEVSADHYKDGVTAFRAEQYDVALAHFTTAYNEGMRSPTLHYNLGVTYFRLEKLEASYAAFARIRDDSEWGALAEFNMGLVRERQGRQAEAQRHFRAAYDKAESPRLRELAAERLRDGAVGAAREPQRSSAWLGMLSLGSGYEDNVVLADNDTALGFAGDGDYFFELFGAAGRYVNGGGSRNGWRLDLGGYYRGYRDLDDFNIGVASVALTHHRAVGKWLLQLGSKVDLQFVGSEHFATVPGLRMQVSRTAGNIRFALRNDFNYVDGSSTFDHLTGWQNRTIVEGSMHPGAALVRAGYELELNDRDDLVSGAEFSSFSPRRHRFFIGAAVPLTARLEVEGRTEYRLSRYREQDIRLDVNDELVEEAKRNEDRVSIRARLCFRPTESWDTFVEYQHTDNDASIGRYRYDNQQLMIGLSRFF
jgi:hypothetical protein